MAGVGLGLGGGRASFLELNPASLKISYIYILCVIARLPRGHHDSMPIEYTLLLCIPFLFEVFNRNCRYYHRGGHASCVANTNETAGSQVFLQWKYQTWVNSWSRSLHFPAVHVERKVTINNNISKSVGVPLDAKKDNSINKAIIFWCGGSWVGVLGRPRLFSVQRTLS